MTPDRPGAQIPARCSGRAEVDGTGEEMPDRNQSPCRDRTRRVVASIAWKRMGSSSRYRDTRRTEWLDP